MSRAAIRGTCVALVLAGAAGLLLLLAGRGANGASVYTMRGKTPQGLAVSLGRLRSSGARLFSYRARLTCSDGTSFKEGRFYDDVRPRRGRFRRRVVTSGGAVVTTVAGTVGARSARGTLVVTERFRATLNRDGSSPLYRRGTILCRSGTVRWSARLPARP